MTIEFQHIIPHPIKNQSYEDSEIWGKHFILNSEVNYIAQCETGKGKSTFISYCYGLRNDYDGQIFINNKNTNTISTDQWAKYRTRKLSFIPQDLKLFSPNHPHILF